ncbi:DUF5753 domain-containing protein [Nocardia sp. NPDC050799]|uniref:DUF5753 domain-containing protein n=1 Tax=Nocardia sp. NPDC050799 TaxID=3154842 RepID=UPI0033EF5BC6
MASASLSPPDPEILAWDDHSLADLQQRTRSTEAASRLLRGYEPDRIPVQLQTRDYATAVLRVCQETSGRPMDERDLGQAVSARMARQADWRARGGEAHFLIGEQALYTTVGSPQVMVAQLEALQEILEEPYPIEVFIIPRGAVFVGPATNFLFYDEAKTTVETATYQITLTERAGLACYETLFERLAAQASSYHAGLNLVTAALGHHLRSAPSDRAASSADAAAAGIGPRQISPLDARGLPTRGRAPLCDGSAAIPAATRCPTLLTTLKTAMLP